MLAISTMYGFSPALSAAFRKVASCIRGEQEQITIPVSCFSLIAFAITACPLCLYNLNKSGNGKLPVHYFTELLAEALGVKEEALQTLTSDKEVAE